MRYLIVFAVAAATFAQRTPDYRIEMTAPLESAELAATRADTDWQFAIDQSKIRLKVTNRGRAAVRVLWDESSFVDVGGSAHRIVPTDTRLMDLNSVKPPLVVPVGSSASVDLIHADMVLRTGGRVIYARLLPFCPKCEELKGKSVSVLLAVDAGGQRSDYRFDFKIVDVK